jgi:hypothetical protein
MQAMDPVPELSEPDAPAEERDTMDTANGPKGGEPEPGPRIHRGHAHCCSTGRSRLWVKASQAQLSIIRQF